MTTHLGGVLLNNLGAYLEKYNTNHQALPIHMQQRELDILGPVQFTYHDVSSCT